MTRHQGDLSFDVPSDWDDRSVVVYAAPPTPEQNFVPNVVLARDALEADETVEQYAEKQLGSLMESSEDFTLVSRSQRMVGDAPAVEIRFDCAGDDGTMLHQRMLLVGDRGGRGAGGSPRGATVFTLTASMPLEEKDRFRPLFDRIFASVGLGTERRS